MSTFQDYGYFRDKKRKVDYVIVYSNDLDPSGTDLAMIKTYLRNVAAVGLQTEEEEGKIIGDAIGVKIHAPVGLLDQYLNKYKIDLSCDNLNFKKEKSLKICGFTWFQNQLNKTPPDDPTYQRAPKIFAGEKPTDYTNAERILIVDKILSELRFSDRPGDRGHSMLRRRKIIFAAYPLHDSPPYWTETGPLSERQILRAYWANMTCMHEQQPLNLIEKYYGPEVGFYFAWLGFYTKMLILASLLGCIFCIIGVIIYALEKETIKRDICASEEILCPICPRIDTCTPEPIRHYCSKILFSYLFHNPATMVYSILMLFWGVIFATLWSRKQEMLKLRWNLTDINIDNSVRPEYIECAPISRVSSITGQTEYYMTLRQKIEGYAFTIACYIAMTILYILGIIFVMYIRLTTLYYGKNSRNQSLKESLPVIEAIESAFLTLIVVSLIQSMQTYVARKMTDYQNPRTQVGYAKNYTTKIVILSLADMLFPLFYLGFFKGHFYTHPGDSTQWTILGMIKSDVCNITGCLVDLTFQMFVIIICKNTMRLIKAYFVPIFDLYIFKLARVYDQEDPNIQPTPWEEDFLLMNVKPDYLYKEYIEMILQYSYTVLFLVAFPIAPILALINNVIEIRLDAINFLLRLKRIVPKKVKGIEEWNTVVYLVTILGTITNPLLLAYNTNLIPKMIYYFNNNYSLKGFVNSTLSDFALVDYKMNRARSMVIQKTCKYYGKRYPPGNKRQYQRTEDFWYELLLRTIFFVILENLCLLVSLLLKYAIPKTPRKVELKLFEDQRILRQTRLQRTKSQSSLHRVNI